MEKEDLEFMSELESAANLKPNTAARLFMWSIVGLFTFLFCWAWISEVEERVRGQGQVMPSSDIQVVQSLEGGVLIEILVRDGDAVKKDQVLLRVDDVQFASEERGIEVQVIGLQAKQARLKAEASGQVFKISKNLKKSYPKIAVSEEKLYYSRQNELKTSLEIIQDEVEEAKANLAEVQASINKLVRSKELQEKELAITERLIKKKAVPAIEGLRLERALNETTGTLATAQKSRQSLRARLSGARKRTQERKNVFKSKVLAELSDIETRMASIGESLKSAESRTSRTVLRAPVDGVVHKLHVTTVGGVIQPAQTLIEIVPATEDLMVRAKVNPSDIAFLKKGQIVRVSISAYDPQLYGTLEGELERISADTVEDQQGNVFFEIDVRTLKNHIEGTDGGYLPIVPGMLSEIEVIVGKRTILTYLMKPVLRTKDRAFTER